MATKTEIGSDRKAQRFVNKHSPCPMTTLHKVQVLLNNWYKSEGCEKHQFKNKNTAYITDARKMQTWYLCYPTLYSQVAHVVKTFDPQCKSSERRSHHAQLACSQWTGSVFVQNHSLRFRPKLSSKIDPESLRKWEDQTASGIFDWLISMPPLKWVQSFNKPTLKADLNLYIRFS